MKRFDMVQFLYNWFVGLILKHSMFVAKANTCFNCQIDLSNNTQYRTSEGSFGYFWPIIISENKIEIGDYMLLEDFYSQQQILLRKNSDIYLHWR